MNKIEERAKIIAEMKEMNEKAKAESRSFTDEETKAYAEKEAQVRKLTSEIEAEKREQALKGFTEEVPAARSDSQAENADGEQRKDFFTAEKRSGEVYMSVGGGGAALAPEEYLEELIKEVEKDGVLYNKVRKIPVTAAGSLGVPYEKEDASDASWTNEIPGSEIGSDTSWEFGKRQLAPTDLVKQILLTKKLLATSALPIDSLTREKLSYKLREAFEKGITVGTGTNQPLGVFTASANGIPTSRDVETATAGQISADDLINMKMSLRPQYRNKAVWVLHTDILKDIMKLKDGENRYLWQPALKDGEPSTLLGLPVIEAEHAPSAKTGGSYVAVLGDLSHYWFAYWKGIDITVLNEKYAGTNQVGFLGHTLADGQPTLPAAFARLKIKAS